MIRLSLVWFFVLFLSIYAWRDWFKSLCGLILFMAVYQHPDLPKTLLGVQGLNPWNVLLFFILLAWISNRDRQENPWDMPKNVKVLLITYLSFVIVSFVRMTLDMVPYISFMLMQNLEPDSFGGLLSEHIINCVKWVIPGILLFDGCRTESRLRMGAACTLGIYVLLAVQVIRWMPLSVIVSGDDLEGRSLKILTNEVGYHRVNMSMLLAGGSWAIFAARDMFKPGKKQLLVTALCAVVFFAMALTGGRMGYVTWALIGLLFGMMRWRRIFVYGPVILVLVVLLIPAAKERFYQGFDPESVDTNTRIEGFQAGDTTGPDYYTITSGRTFAWSWVLSKIGERPFLGHGREGMVRTGISAELWLDYGESFPHPHNAYLQWILDNGIIGFIPIFMFYGLMMKMATKAFRGKAPDINSAIGGIAVALLGALLVAGMGSQSFYPREGAVGMWCAIGLLLRVFVEKTRASGTNYSKGSTRNIANA